MLTGPGVAEFELEEIDAAIKRTEASLAHYSDRAHVLRANLHETNRGLIAVAQGFHVTPDDTRRRPPIDLSDLNGRNKKAPTPIQLGMPGTSLSELPAESAAMGILLDRWSEGQEQLSKLRVDLALAGETLQRLPSGSPAFKDTNEEVFRLRQQIEQLEKQLGALGPAFASAARLAAHGLRLDGPHLVGNIPVDERLAAARAPQVIQSSRAVNLIASRATIGEGTRAVRAAAASGLSWNELAGPGVREGLQVWAGSREAYEKLLNTFRAGGDDMNQIAGVAVSAFGTMVQAAMSGTASMEEVVVTGFANIAQAALAKTDPLLGTVVGVVGGILGGLFSARETERTQPVRVEEYSSRAMSQRSQKDGPDRVILQIIDPGTGETISSTEYQLGRRERLDAVQRLPPRR